MVNSSIGMIAFLAAFISFSTFSPIETTDATDLILSAQTNGSTVSITNSANDVNLSLQAGSAGAIQTSADTVYVTSGSTGYQLYVSTSGTETALTRLDGDASTIPTLSSNNNPVPITSPTNLENNTWGFALEGDSTSTPHLVTSAFSSNDYTDPANIANKFAGMPSKGNDVKIATSNTTASEEPIILHYGAKVTSAIPSGTYGNTVVYTAIGNATTEGLASITPERTNQLAGGETIIVSTPSTTALSSISSTSVTIGGATCTHPTPSKNGALTNITCTSPALATGWHEVIATITTTSDTTETYVVNPGIEYYSDAQTLAMQDFTVTECVAMNPLESITLIDSRDQNTYRVTKQADGNCWMTENLRLGNNPDSTSTIANSIILTPNDSDIPADGTNFTIDSALIQTSTFVPTGYDTNWNDSNWDKERIYSFTADADSTTSATNKRAYGNLYNWYTATAGTGTTTGVIGGADAPASICPKGWKLPPNEGDGSYTMLMQSTSTTNSISTAISGNSVSYVEALQKPPLSFVLSSYYGGSPSETGSHGVYWSRTSHYSNQDLSRDLDFYTSNGNYYLQSALYKYYGFAVRCVLPTIMQNFSALACSNLKTAQTITLTDSRDLKTYNIAKLDDNICRMTSDLHLGSDSQIKLTIDDTDLVSTNVYDSGQDGWYTPIVQASGTDSWASPVDAKHIYQQSDSTYGNLYNWYTATAGTGTSSISSDIDATSSICPKGWKLPPNSGVGSYINLTAAAGITHNSAGSTKLNNAPYSFLYTGIYDQNGFHHNGSGYYWSRTSQSNSNAYYLVFSSVDNAPQYTLNKYLGHAVRCYFAS